MPWTRTEVAEQHLHVTTSTLRSYERAAGFRPSGAAAFQEFASATYDPADIAVLQIIHHAAEIGIAGSNLAKVHDAAKTLRPFLKPGWRGLCVTTDDGRAWQIGDGAPGPASVNDVADSLADDVRITAVVSVVVPE